MGATNRVGIGLLYRPAKVGSLSPAMGARNKVGIGLSYRPARLCSLDTQFQTRFLVLIPRPVAGLKFSTQATQAGGSHSLESIPGLHKCLKIRTVYCTLSSPPPLPLSLTDVIILYCMCTISHYQTRVGGNTNKCPSHQYADYLCVGYIAQALLSVVITRCSDEIWGPIHSPWLGGYSRLWHMVVVPARQECEILKILLLNSLRVIFWTFYFPSVTHPEPKFIVCRS